SDSIGSSRSRTAAAARLYPHLLCVEACTAARSRSSDAMRPLVSMPEPEPLRPIMNAVSNSPSNQGAHVRPAATVVVVRDSPSGPEVFMVRRHEGTAFMGGA